MCVSENLRRIREELPETVRLLAVSKNHSESMILEAYHTGQRIFGENRVQELLPKYERLPKDIEWHFIGHLQTNKVKYIVPFIDTIQSIDSTELLEKVNKETAKFNRKIKVLLQVHIAMEEHKFGYSSDEIIAFSSRFSYNDFPNIIFAGLMGMATFTDNREQIRSEFNRLKSLFQKIKTNYFAYDDAFHELSMGMSDDYPIALEMGTTIVRIGSKIFGTR
jgi:pyridoxal phosphate enzyme (YggS family)